MKSLHERAGLPKAHTIIKDKIQKSKKNRCPFNCLTNKNLHYMAVAFSLAIRCICFTGCHCYP